jgi:hypothetical protein
MGPANRESRAASYRASQYHARMARLRDFVDRSKIARAAVSTLGVGATLGLLLSLTLWAFALRDVAMLSGGIGEEYAYTAYAWRGQVLCGVMKVKNPLLRFALLREARVAKTTPTPVEAVAWARETEDRWFRVSLFATEDLPVDVSVPLWPVALLFLTALTVAIALSFRFTVRTVAAASSLYGVVLGWLAAIAIRSS